MKTALILLGAAAGLWFLFIFLPAVIAFFAIFSRHKRIALTPENAGAYGAFAEEMLAAQEALRALPGRQVQTGGLCAEYVEAPGADVLVIFAHGFRADPLRNFGAAAKHLHGQGFSLLFPDARAHGRSAGRLSSLGLRESGDLLEWVRFAASHLPERKIVVWGTSMGGASVAFASDRLRAASAKVRCAVVDCAFESPWDQVARDCARRHLPVRLVMPVMRLCGRVFFRDDLRRSVREPLGASSVPVLFLHGSADATVPCPVGIGNYEACASEKSLLIAEGAAHTMAYVAGGAELRGEVDAFLDRTLRNGDEL